MDEMPKDLFALLLLMVFKGCDFWQDPTQCGNHTAISILTPHQWSSHKIPWCQQSNTVTHGKIIRKQQRMWKGWVEEWGKAEVGKRGLRNKLFDKEAKQWLFEFSKYYTDCDFFRDCLLLRVSCFKKTRWSDNFFSLSVLVWCSDPVRAQRHLYHWTVTATHIHKYTNT